MRSSFGRDGSTKTGHLDVLNLYHEVPASSFDRHQRWPMPGTAVQNLCFILASLEGSPWAWLVEVPRADPEAKGGDRS